MLIDIVQLAKGCIQRLEMTRRYQHQIIDRLKYFKKISVHKHYRVNLKNGRKRSYWKIFLKMQIK